MTKLSGTWVGLGLGLGLGLVSAHRLGLTSRLATAVSRGGDTGLLQVGDKYGAHPADRLLPQLVPLPVAVHVLDQHLGEGWG